MANPSPPTRRVRADFLPTWGKFGSLKVLSMEPYAFPALRDLIYLPDQGVMERAHWGLVADLANLLHARAHVIFGFAPPEPVAGAYSALVNSWFERPGQIVVAGNGEGASLINYLVGDNDDDCLLEPPPDFAFELPDYLLHSFLPKTGEAKRAISKQVWGDE